MNKHQHALMYSMAAALVVIAFSLSIYLAGVTNTAWNYLSYIFLIGIIVVAVKNWRDKVNGGVLSFGKTFGYTTWFTLYYCLVMAIWTFIFMTYIAPGFMESQMMKQEAIMESKGMPPEQMEMAMKMARKFATPTFAATMTIVGGMFIGSIVNLVIAAIMKKDAPVSFDEQSNSSAV